jgi:hypothetical protein
VKSDINFKQLGGHPMMALSNFLTINKNNTVEALTSEVGPSTGDIMKSRKQGSRTRESKTSTWKKLRMRRVLRHGLRVSCLAQ